MATFKVGQRVRKINNGDRRKGVSRVPVGAVGTIIGRDPDGTFEWTVVYDGVAPVGNWPHNFADSEMLAPLTDPLADAFIERIKKLEPLREPATV